MKKHRGKLKLPRETLRRLDDHAPVLARGAASTPLYCLTLGCSQVCAPSEACTGPKVPQNDSWPTAQHTCG